MENKYCRFYLIRHGETEFNVQKITQGHVDSPLTEKGISQAKITAELLKDIHFDAIFSSDLLRAQKTAEIVKAERDLAIQTTEALRERNFGIGDGKKGEALAEYTRIRQTLSDLERMKYKADENFESDEEIGVRLATFMREIAVGYPNKNVLLSTHGTILKYFLVHLGELSYAESDKYTIENGKILIVDCDGDDFVVKDRSALVER
jgi:broad specificity phosphatase PhoE